MRLQRVPGRPFVILASHLNMEPVSFVPRENMKVDMEDFLMGGLTIGQEEIDPFAAQIRVLESLCQPLSRLKDTAARFGLQIR